jgi:plasmid stability protein
MIRTTVRVPDDLYARVRAAAARWHRSIHGHILTMLERAPADEEQDTCTPIPPHG